MKDIIISGNQCNFTIKNNTGYKKYKTKQICDFAYNAQKEASDYGYAPPVIERVDEYTYTTELADTSFFQQYLPYKKEGKVIYFNRLFPEMHSILIKIFKNNPIKHTIPPDGVDMTSKNLGLYKGRVVMIDFA